MNQAQQKLTDIIVDYKTIFPDEYKAFVIQQKAVRDGLINEFASVKGDTILERRLFDTPATLHAMFSSRLESEELKWFNTKEGGRWFAKNFKEFRASNKL